MVQKKDKDRLSPLVPLLITTIESRAWRELSHGAKVLYVSLKRHVRKGRNTAFLSHRDAVKELKSSRRKIAEWYAELEHFGFLVKISHGGIGLEGKGIAPHWRLTELGATSNANADGVFEPPTADFHRWDGTPFRRRRDARTPGEYGCQKQNPGSDVEARVAPTGEPRVAPTGEPPKSGGGSDGGTIERTDPGSDVGTITRLTTREAVATDTPAPSDPFSLEIPAFLRRNNTSAPSTENSDPRLASLSRWGRAANSLS